MRITNQQRAANRESGGPLVPTRAPRLASVGPHRSAFVSLRNLNQERASRSRSNRRREVLANLMTEPLLAHKLAKLKAMEKEWGKIKHNLAEWALNNTCQLLLNCANDRASNARNSLERFSSLKARSLSRSKCAEVFARFRNPLRKSNRDDEGDSHSEDVPDDPNEGAGRYPNKEVQKLSPELHPLRRPRYFPPQQVSQSHNSGVKDDPRSSSVKNILFSLRDLRHTEE